MTFAQIFLHFWTLKKKKRGGGSASSELFVCHQDMMRDDVTSSPEKQEEQTKMNIPAAGMWSSLAVDRVCSPVGVIGPL